MEICTIGTKVYYSSVLSGLVKGVIVKCSDPDHIFIKVTSKSECAYRRGNIYDVEMNYTFPRTCYHKTRSFHYYVTPFQWKFTEDSCNE